MVEKEFTVKVKTPDEYTTNWAIVFLTKGLEDSSKELAESSPLEYTPSDFEVVVIDA